MNGSRRLRYETVGVMTIASKREAVFTPDDGELFLQIAGQIAIAVENALAYREIDALKNKLASEKLYLEDEIRTEHNFEELIGATVYLASDSASFVTGQLLVVDGGFLASGVNQ